MMHMTLYWGKEVTLIIDSWNTDSWLGYLLTLLACFVFSAFYQYMEDRRLRFKAIASAPSASTSTAAPLLVRLSGRPSRFVTALLFGVNSALGYLLMLAIMSYNGGVFLAIVLGLAVGYFVFRAGDVEFYQICVQCFRICASSMTMESLAETDDFIPVVEALLLVPIMGVVPLKHFLMVTVAMLGLGLGLEKANA